MVGVWGDLERYPAASKEGELSILNGPQVLSESDSSLPLSLGDFRAIGSSSGGGRLEPYNSGLCGGERR